MSKITLFIASICCSISSLAQAPAIDWQKSLGGSLNEFGCDISQTTDGGYIVVGNSNSNDHDVSGFHGGVNGDLWVVKLNNAGSIVWQKSLGGSGDDYGNNVLQTPDGGYIIVGWTTSVDGDVAGSHGADMWVLKLSAAGDLIWQKPLGGSHSEMGYCIRKTFDGNYIIAGATSSDDGDVATNHGSYDFWLVKLSPAGDLIWEKTYGGTGSDYGMAVEQTSDGGYIITGMTGSNNGDVSGSHSVGFYSDVWVIKVNSVGTMEWQKCYGGTLDERALNIKQTPDGGYIFAAWSTSPNGDITDHHTGTQYDNDYWVVKINATGSIEWQKSIGGAANDRPSRLLIAPDGGYIVAGSTNSTDGDVTWTHGFSNYDYWLVKLHSDGSLAWQKTMGGNENDAAASVCATSDGGYALIGFGGSVSGDITNWYGQGDYWVVKVMAENAVENTNYQASIDFYPNPTHGSITISGGLKTNLTATNSIGQTIKTAQNSNQISIAEYPAGLYFITATDDYGRFVKTTGIMKE